MEGNALSGLVTAITGTFDDLKTPIITIASAAVAIFGIFLGIRYLVRAAKSVK